MKLATRATMAEPELISILEGELVAMTKSSAVIEVQNSSVLIREGCK
jgi:hypothetical protein